MASLARLARLEVVLLIGGFTAVILWKLLTGGLRLNGLLSVKEKGASAVFSPGRAQLLAFTIFTAIDYLMQTIHDPSKLPQLPATLVTALGGSQAIYLGGKAWSAIGGFIKEKK
jgi:hypothetical protein